MQDLKYVINELNKVMIYGREGILINKLEEKKGFKTLEEVRSDLEKLKSIREELLNAFRNDSLREINSFKDKNEIKFPRRGIITMNYLDLELFINSRRVSCLLSKNGIESINTNDLKIEEKISKMLPFVKSLLDIYNNTDTRSILSNDIYNDLYVLFDSPIKELIINNNGVILSDSSLSKLNLTLDEKIELIGYYYDNIKSILEKILVKDDIILDNYRTDLSKKKVLTYYKRGIK